MGDVFEKKAKLPKGYFWLIRIAGLFSFVAFYLVIQKTAPEDGVWTKVLFFLTLFIFASCFFNLTLLRFRRKFMLEGEVSHNIVLSFRQGILLALLLVIILVLQGLRMLLWWDGLLAVAGIFIIELYFLTKD